MRHLCSDVVLLQVLGVQTHFDVIHIKWHVMFMWQACDVHVTSMWCACDMHVMCMWYACVLVCSVGAGGSHLATCPSCHNFSSLVKAPDVMNKMLQGATCNFSPFPANLCELCSGMITCVPSRILSRPCCTPSPPMSLRWWNPGTQLILSTSSRKTMPKEELRGRVAVKYGAGDCRRVLGWMERKVQEWVEEESRVEGWIGRESRKKKNGDPPLCSSRLASTWWQGCNHVSVCVVCMCVREKRPQCDGPKHPCPHTHISRQCKTQGKHLPAHCGCLLFDCPVFILGGH